MGERFDRAFRAFRPESASIDPREVVIKPGWNVREMSSPETREHVASLKASILLRGVDKPIAVRYDQPTGTVTLVDGQCRLTALRELWDEGQEVYVPCVRVKGDEAELTAESLTSNSGHPLTQWEIGAGCRRLLKFGWSPNQIAAHICKQIRYVNDAIALAEVPLEAKAMLNEGTVTPARVLQEVKEHGEKAVKVLRQAVEDAPKPAQKTLRWVKVKSKPLARTKAPSAKEKAGNALEIGGELARHIIHDDIPFDKLEELAQSFLQSAGMSL